MPAVATRKKDAPADASKRTARVVALTHAFQDLKRYRRGDELDIEIVDGQDMPAWCIAEEQASRTRDGKVDLNALPLFFPANSR